MLKRFSLVFLVVLLVSLPVSVQAQEDDSEEWLEFTSEDGAVTFSYPEEWVAYEDALLRSIYIGNSQELIERIQDDPTAAYNLESGDVLMNITALPTALLNDPGILQEEMEPADLVTAIANYMLVANTVGGDMSTPEVSPLELEEAETVEISETLSVGVLPYSGDENIGQGVIIAFETDGILILAVMATDVGEFTEDMETVALEILATFQMNVSAEELMEQFMGGGEIPTIEVTAEPGD